MKKGSQQTSGKLGGGRDDGQRGGKNSYSMTPNDHMVIFMSASKQIATSTDGPLEKNARIFKWLNNCKNARD